MSVGFDYSERWPRERGLRDLSGNYKDVTAYMTCRALTSGDLSAKEAVKGLRKVLSTGINVPGLQQYAQMAFHSPEPSIRELAVQQIGKSMQVNLQKSSEAES